MAKRNSNFRNKKIQAPKPYDVSNSFVRKVASRVTELLPQSLWPTKWFSSINHEVNTQGNGRASLNTPLISEKDDSDLNPTPAKRPRIPINSTFSGTVLSPSSPVAEYEVTRRLRHPLPTSNEVDDDECVAGPSGLQRQYSVGNLESSNPKSRDSFCYDSKKAEVNGEDHSDSSESTSGCSSLPQGDHNVDIRNTNRGRTSESQVNGPKSVSRTSLKRRYSEAANYSSMATHSTRLFPGFGNFSPSKKDTPVPVGRRRNPSFDPDTFCSPNWSGEKINIKDRIVNSPFYSGRTTYGGMSAYRSNHKGTNNESQCLRNGHRSIQVHPVNASVKDDSSAMSNTARRILEALEMFSSPIQDAKKIPLDGGLNMRRRKVLANPGHSSSSMSASSHLAQDTHSASSWSREMAPPVKELVVPTVPDILALRRRQRLQGYTVAAREAAAESRSMLPLHVEEVPDRSTYSHPDNRSGGRSGGKITSKMEMLEETLEEPDLPNIALPITSLPKFDFLLPTACPPPPPPSSYNNNQSNPSVFKFSSPIAFSKASESLISTNNFTFSTPLKTSNKDVVEGKGSRTDVLSVDKSVERSLGSEGFDQKMRGVGYKDRVTNSGSFGEKTAEQKQFGAIVEKEKDKTYFSGNISGGKGSFGDQFKPAPGTWECETCMVRNKSDVSKCVACETPNRLSSKSESSNGSKTQSEVKSGFGDLFKPPSGSWSCDVCMINNPSEAVKCQACETPKSKGSDAVSNIGKCKTDETASVVKGGFGDKFKKPEGAWECSICLVMNKVGGPPKCVACEAPKPGLEQPVAAPSKTSSSTKFSFGNPVQSGFNFGMDKAGDIQKKDSNEETKPSFTFGIPISSASSGLGAKSEDETKSTGFTFGIPATSETDSSKKTAPQSPPQFTFGAKETLQKPKKSSEELANVQSEKEKIDGSLVIVTAAPKEPEFKFGVAAVSSPTSSTGIVATVSSSKPLTLGDSKPSFTFGAADGKKELATNSNFTFGCSTAAGKPEDGKAKSFSFGNPATSASSLPAISTSTGTTSWMSMPLSKVDSSPKMSLFSQTVTTASPSNPERKQEESPKAVPLFKFGNTAKTDSTNNNNNKSQEVPKMVSSNFKFQEPPKTSSMFKVEENPKTTSTSTSTITPSSSAPSPFTAAASVFSGSNNEKTAVSKEEPASISVSSSSTSGDLAALKNNSSTPVFMFGGESSSPSTAFNLIGQKQPSQIPTSTTDVPVKPFASIPPSNIFGNISSSKPLFGSNVSPSPSPAAASVPASSSESRNVPNTAFFSPTPSALFGSTVSTTVSSTTAAATTTTTTVSSTSSSFGTSVFGSVPGNTFTAGAASAAPAFASSNTNPLAPAPTFGAPVSSASSVFGMNSNTSNAPFSFTGATKPPTEEPQSQSTNTPFVFGSNAAPTAPQPFSFSAAPSKPSFSFGGSVGQQQPAVGTGGAAPAPAPAPALGGFTFGEASKTAAPFGSSQPAGSITGGTSNPFGQSPAVPTASIAPLSSSFGAPLSENNSAGSGTFGASTFNYGSSQPLGVFSFNSNQPGNISQNPGFNFGQAPQPNATPSQVTFNPNMPPTFNFTGGATPQFTATPNAMPRRFKKAVRRSQQPR